ncbi:MAG: glycosyltransferase family 9 protein, partial [Chloroflexi bacterium]|nr:glycosyltransferase family 9 protein [Chloroflexota bacterium]
LPLSPVLSALPFLARIPGRVGLDSFGRGFSLTTTVPTREMKHEAELYLDTARAVGIQPVKPALEFYPSSQAQERVETKMVAQSLPEPLVVIHPGGGANPGMTLLAKRWPAFRFAHLADRLIETYAASIIVVGGEADADLAKVIAGEMKHPSTNLVGQLSLDELGALCQRATLYIGNDTGATHLATAVGASVVAIFGPSSPVMYGAYGPKAMNVWKDAGCNPCFVLGRVNDACRQPRCIEAVQVDDVWAAVQRQMGDRR